MMTLKCQNLSIPEFTLFAEFSYVYFLIQLKIILFVVVEWISDKYQIFQNLCYMPILI